MLGMRTEVIGKRFGKLLVVGKGAANRNRSVLWECRCDCGARLLLRYREILRGASSRCKCTRRQQTQRMSNSAEYKSWVSMRQRCSPGGAYFSKGVAVCERWSSFANFMADMGSRPSPNHSIDRIKNNGNYEPENCRWATPTEQNRNKSNNRIFTVLGIQRTLSELADEYDIKASTIARRVDVYGWTIERAIMTPTKTSDPKPGRSEILEVHAEQTRKRPPTKRPFVIAR